MDPSKIHVIPSHQTRPSDDPIFAAHQEATARRARVEHRDACAALGEPVGDGGADAAGPDHDDLGGGHDLGLSGGAGSPSLSS